MGSKKAARAYLKESKTTNTPALLEKDRRDCETLFDPQCIGAIAGRRAGHNLAARQASLSCRSCKGWTCSPSHLARAVALLRNKRGIGTDHWTLLELKALHEVAIASLANIVIQIDVRLAIPLQCLTNLNCLLPKQGGERNIVLQSQLHVLWSSCHADSIRSWGRGQGAFLGLCGQRLQSSIAILRRRLPEMALIHGQSTCMEILKSSMTPSM